MHKSILITGCSSGIGLTSALVLKERGYRVFATARKQTDVAELKDKGFESLLMDMNDSVSIRSALDEILSKTNGTLDALFNNAGFAIPGATEDLSRDMMRMQFETNVFGPMELTNLVLPIMRKQGYGRIIQNSSMLGVITMPFRSAYNASKFALEGFSRTLRQELRGTGIFVSLLVPGPIKTSFRKNAQQKFSETLKNKESRHQDTYKTMEKNLEYPSAIENMFTKEPKAVVEKLILALESKHPKLHYYVTIPAHLSNILRRILSDNALDWVIDKSVNEKSR